MSDSNLRCVKCTLSKTLGLNRHCHKYYCVRQAPCTQSGCRELFQVLQQVIAYLCRQAGLASRTCLSWDYQFYCSLFADASASGVNSSLSLSLSLSLSSLFLFLSKKEMPVLYAFRLDRPTVSAIFLFLLLPEKIVLFIFDYLSFIPIFNRSERNSGTERAALPQLFSTREFLIFRSTLARITFYSAKYATSRINARGCLTDVLARGVNKRKGLEKISVIRCPSDNMSYHVI